MFTKKSKGISVLLLVIIILCSSLTACQSKAELKMNATLTISKLSDSDFQEIGTKDVTKDDFRKVKFSYDMENCGKLSNRKIAIPELRGIMNAYDVERYWYGSSTKNDNVGADYVLYSNDIMFYSKGLDNEGIKSVFKDAKINISWTDEGGKDTSDTINLSDIIIFN